MTMKFPNKEKNKMKKSILILVTILLLTSMACTFSVDIPRVETGNTQSVNISENAPDNNATGFLSIIMGGGRLAIKGQGDQWVSGKVDYNVSFWQPEVNRSGPNLKITQDTKENIGLPNNKIVNDWDLAIGNVSTDLEIKAGAYKGNLDFSGIPLTNLQITDGASQAEITFDQLNPEVMKSLIYKTGASQISLYGLANANFNEMQFDGGAGAYTLDFSGELQHDTDVSVNFGLGDVKIIIPKGVPAQVIVDGGLNNVDLTGTWSIDGSVYEVNGTGPKLYFRVKMGLGNLQLISR
jgi:hypothetical protein